MIKRERCLRVGASTFAAVVMGLATSVVVAREAIAADAGSSAVDAGADAGADASDAEAPGSTSAGDEYLRSMARRLLDNSDIVKAGRDLLERPARPPTGPAPVGTSATGTGTGAKGGPAGTTGVAGAGPKGSPVGTAGGVAAGGKGTPLGATGAVGPGAKGSPVGTSGAVGPGGGVGDTPGGLADGAAPEGVAGTDDATAAAATDAADGADSASANDATADEASSDAGAGEDAAAAPSDDRAGTGPFAGGGRGAKGAPNGSDPLPMKGAEDSPLAKMGIPAKAVPAVATAAAAGAMAIWPAIAKTFTGLLKKLLAAKLKDRAKKTEKVDHSATTYRVLGMPVRPAELASIAIAALVYGLAISYTFQGFKMQRSFVLSQEILVFLLFYFRSIIRFAYERAYKLTTQYRFWVMGGILCLGTAYLGNPLGTVGFELDAAKTPEETRRALRLKAVLVAVGFAMAIVFYFWNRVSPGKLLQSGRVMMSGAALAEILPIAPMPGKKILGFSKPLWLLMFAVIVPGFFVLNFMK